MKLLVATKWLSLGFCGSVVSLAIAPVSHAAIIGGTAANSGGFYPSNFIELTAPVDPVYGPITTGTNQFEIEHVFGFNEEQNVLLNQALNVDGGTIAAGTRIASHYFIYDSDYSLTVAGSIQFDETILGIITRDGLLFASDSLLGIAGVNYNNPLGVGLEAIDSISFSGSQLSFELTGSNPGDHFRVITAAPEQEVPEPLTIVGSLLAIGGGTLLKRRHGDIKTESAE